MIFPKYKFKLHTFDKSIFKRNWGAINESPLKRAGLLARKIERGLIRRDTSKSQRPSPPGKPPKSRAPGHPFKRIFSEPNIFETNVVIGHAGFYGGQTAMEIQEFGQRVRIRTPIRPKKQHRVTDPAIRKKLRKLYLRGKIKGPKLQFTDRTVKMPERPFARPTTQRLVNKLPKLWANSVTPATVRSR